ncbi:PREDICTED: ribonuclease H1-like [Trachymyrmex cornetzi]|uniref:ribonuclease H1-like n=1 Tax=Trachymyrmex cornetzi TaxID=471704 RepID=UPI00084F3214|nr:PREDICTED: ribonuclease H1-like [Trachymyrmex cornetzi]
MIKHYKSCIKRSRFLAAFLYPYSTNILTLSCSCVYTGTKDDTPNELIIRQFQEFLYPLDQEDYVSFYTDGSRFDLEDYIGTGIYAPSLNLEIAHRLPSGTSVFTAEAWALLMTIKIICNRNISKAVIFSDSRSVLDSLASTRSDLGNYLIYAIKYQFSQATSKNLNIKLVWIPSHKGISGNERTDELAKLGAARGDRWGRPGYPIFGFIIRS